MDFRTRIGYALIGVAALIASALLVVSCSKKPTSIDPSFTVPEGTLSSQIIPIVWRERPVEVIEYRDSPPIGVSPDDREIGRRLASRYPVGAINGAILDPTAATAFQVFRSEPGGGIRSLTTSPITARRKWLDQHWEVFPFLDFAPPTSITPTYVARGLLSGSPTVTSPLSVAASARGESLFTIPVAFPPYYPPTGLPIPNDSTLFFVADRRASRYFLQVFAFRGAGREEQILSGQPVPFYVGSTQDFFLLDIRLPAVAAGAPTVVPITAVNITVGSTSLVRIAAVDGNGELVGHTLGDTLSSPKDISYERVLRGSFDMPRPKPVEGGGGGGGGIVVAREVWPARAAGAESGYVITMLINKHTGVLRLSADPFQGTAPALSAAFAPRGRVIWQSDAAMVGSRARLSNR